MNSDSMEADGKRGKEEQELKQGRQRDAWDILQRPAQWLWEKREARGRPVGSAAARKRMEALSALYGQARAGEEYRQFQIGKYERLLALFLTGTALTAALLGAFWLRGKEALTALERPATGEGSKNLSLNLQIGDEPPARVHLDVPERALTPEEEEWLLAEAADRLSSQMEGDGWNPDAVSSDIALPGELCGGLVEVGWQSSDYELMDGSGRIRKELPDEEGEGRHSDGAAFLRGKRTDADFSPADRACGNRAGGTGRAGSGETAREGELCGQREPSGRIRRPGGAVV